MDAWGIRGVPTLCLLKEDGTLASKDCRSDISADMGSDAWATFEKWQKLAK